MANFIKLGYIFLALSACLILLVFFKLPDNYVHVIACDVGQGDAEVIVYKNIQILTDGGPDKKVLTCLGRHIPFWDRQIELVISTHPDADHLTGLIEIVKKFRVDQIIVNPIDSGTPTLRLLETQVWGKKVKVLKGIRGQSVGLGMMHLDILNPSDTQLAGMDDLSGENKLGLTKSRKNTNPYSVVYQFSFKKFKGYFLGDIDTEVSDELVVNRLVQQGNYIKIPHHGSTNGITDNFLKAVKPKFAVISVGRKNKWGLPSDKILEILNENNIKTLRTDLLGDVEIVTDGEKMWLKK